MNKATHQSKRKSKRRVTREGVPIRPPGYFADALTPEDIEWDKAVARDLAWMAAKRYGFVQGSMPDRD